MWKPFLSKRNSDFLTPFIAGFFFALAIVVGCGLHAKSRSPESNSSVGTSSGATPGVPETSLLRQSSESFRAVAKAVGPAVVTIKSTIMPKKPRAPRYRQGPWGGGEGPGSPNPDDPFYQFFRQFMQPFGAPPEQQAPQTALGSGIIIDKRGYIVTNNHVIQNGEKIVVNLPDEENKDLHAKIMGTDPKSDLAVIKIDAGKDLPTAEWADSDQVEVGDWALAIGSPFMLTHSVTLGIVSAKGRSSSNITGSDYSYDMLQTDAAINPGNSGGPLCTIDAKVMGVNTAIFTESGGYMGIGFAIPSNLAKDITSTLMRGEKVVRGWLGVSIQPTDSNLAKELGITGGVMVHQVEKDSPADKAGIRAGDVIYEVEGKSVRDPGQVQHLVSSQKPGTTVAIKVVDYSDKKKKTLQVKLGLLPSTKAEKGAGGLPGEGESTPDRLGLMVSPAENGKGVQVDKIAEGSIAQMAGLMRGDVILSINRHPIRSVSDYEAQVKSSKTANLLVNRNGQEMFFQLTSD